jgi:GMP synthase (glutamine-hydrolysing)
MENKILIINLCKERLHYFEFVKPIEDILKKEGKEYETVTKKFDKKILKKFSKVIICGTSLQDNEYLEKIKDFEWIKDYNGKLLGICAGMQIICAIFGCKLKKNLDIGMKMISIKQNFLGINGWNEVYSLHSNSIVEDYHVERKFFIFSQGSIDAIKHREKDIYGVLFHPEARQKEIIKNFVSS